MQTIVSGRLVTARENSYEKDGAKRVFRNVIIQTGGLDSMPDEVRVNGQNPAAVDAFQELAKLEFGAEVQLVVEIEAFGPSKSMSINLLGLPAAGRSRS